MRTRPLILALALAAAYVLPAAATEGGQIDAQVTPAAPCVIVGGDLDFGTLPFSTPNEVDSERRATTSFTNCTVQSEKIYVRGTDATSATSDATWLLTGAAPCAIGPDNYALGVGDDNSGLFVSNTDRLLKSSVAAGATTTLHADLHMPCSGSSGMGEQMNFSIILTASF